MSVFAYSSQKIDGFCSFRSVNCLVLFDCRPLNGNGKTIILCVLCDSSEAGGEYKLTYLHSKAGTFNLAEGLMDQLMRIYSLIIMQDSDNNLVVNRILSRKNGPVYHSIKSMRPLKNVNFCSSSRKAIILTTGIHGVFRGLKFEPDA